MVVLRWCCQHTCQSASMPLVPHDALRVPRTPVRPRYALTVQPHAISAAIFKHKLVIPLDRLDRSDHQTKAKRLRRPTPTPSRRPASAALRFSKRPLTVAVMTQVGTGIRRLAAMSATRSPLRHSVAAKPQQRLRSLSRYMQLVRLSGAGSLPRTKARCMRTVTLLSSEAMRSTCGDLRRCRSLCVVLGRADRQRRTKPRIGSALPARRSRLERRRKSVTCDRRTRVGQSLDSMDWVQRTAAGVFPIGGCLASRRGMWRAPCS
jgi:hypothetical protein